MQAQLFLVGTFWFWALLIASAVIVVLFTNAKNGTGSTLVCIGTVLLLQFLGNANLLGHAWANIWVVLGIFVLYFILGTIWMIHKWRSFVIDNKEEFLEVKSKWLRDKGVAPSVKNVPVSLQEEWASYVVGKVKGPNGLFWSNPNRIDREPDAKDHKTQILWWMTWWLPDLASDLFYELVSGIFKRIYRRIVNLLQRIATNAYSDLETDLPVPGSEPKE